jgi:hypothetical protein
MVGREIMFEDEKDMVEAVEGAVTKVENMIGVGGKWLELHIEGMVEWDRIWSEWE